QLQVDQVEQQLLTGRSTMLTDQQQFLDAIDRFKLQLGMPVDVPLVLEDSAMRDQLKMFTRFENIVNQYESLNEEADNFQRKKDAKTTDVRPFLRKLLTTSALVKGTAYQTRALKMWDSWAALSKMNDHKEVRDRLNKLLEERRLLFEKKTKLESEGKSLPPADVRRAAELEIEIYIGSFELVLREFEAEPWKREIDPTRSARQRNNKLRDVINSFSLVLIPARNERLEKLRPTWPELPRICVQGVDLLRADLD